jgi:RHS repeat-associated protein
MKQCGAGILEGTGDIIAEIIGTDSGNAKAVFYLSNHRGDTLAAYLTWSGTDYTAAKYRFDAFGNVRESSALYAPRFTFSTKEYLSDAKLYLYAYRVYDPVAGRWTQRDPIDYQDSLNLYQFCGNNPVNFWDATGCVIWNQFWKGIGAMATGVGMMVVGGGILVGTAPTVAGAAAGAGLVVAGHYPVVMGLGKTIAALNDKPLDIPATGGDLAGKGAASAAKACGASQTSTTAIQEGVGLAVDSALSGGIKSPASVSAFTKPVSTIGDTATGVAAIRETTEQAKNEISKLNEKKHDQ